MIICIIDSGRHSNAPLKKDIIWNEMTPMISNKPTATDEEFMLCKVCLQHFDPLERRPKQLPCSHIYCHQCIDNHMTKEKKNYKKVKCPICNRCSFYDNSSNIDVCKHSVDLVTSFKHLLKNSKPHRDVHDEDMDACGVEKSKRFVVKKSNPLLHPSNNWSQVDWRDDENNVDFGVVDDDNNLLGSRQSSLFKNNDIKSNTQSSLINGPLSLKNIWNHHLVDNNGSKVDSIPDQVDKHFSYLHDEDKNINDISVDHQLYPSFQSKSTKVLLSDHASPTTQQYFRTNSANSRSESDDLDWNYFTQNLDTPKSTLTRDAIIDNFNNFPANGGTQPQNKSHNFDSRLNSTTEILQTGDLISPSLIRSSQNGNLLIILDQTNIQILTIGGASKKRLKVQGEINDACVINNEEAYDVTIATASKDGITLYNSSSGEIMKSIPIGPTRFIASFKKGFLAVNNDSLNFCQDLSCNLVLHSINNIRTNASISQSSHTFRGLMDIQTHNDLIGLLFKDQISIIDQSGSLLQVIRLMEGVGIESTTNVQLSFNSIGNILAVLYKDKQLLEIQNWGLHTGSERSSVHELSDFAPHIGGRFISGTMAGDENIVAIVRGDKGFGVQEFNIN